MAIVFKCSSLYTIFTAAVLCETEYREEETILLLSSQSNPNMKNFFENFQKTLVFFDKIIILNDASIDVNDVENEVNKIIKQYKIDIFHMFLYDTYSLFFQKLLPSKTKIIFTEEGTLTYQPKKNYEIESNTIYFCNRLADIISMNWERIDEVALYQPEVFDGSLNVPVKKIHIEYLISENLKREAFLKKINNFFGYIPKEEDYEVIYFDNNLCETGCIQSDFERRFLKYVMEVIQEYKYTIKLHPHEIENFYKFRYDNKPIKIQKDSCIPWEIVFLNKMHRNTLQNLIVMSAGSTAEYNSIIIGREIFPNVKYISLLKIWIPYVTENKLVLDQYNNVDIFYSLLEKDKGYRPESFQELLQIFNTVFHKQNEISFNEKKEIEWLQKRCIRKGMFLHSTIEESEIHIKTDRCTYNEITVYDYTDDVINIKFDFKEQVNIQNCEFEWIVCKNTICKNVTIEKIYTVENLKACNIEYSINRTEVNKNLKKISFESDKDVVCGRFYYNKLINNICISFKRTDIKVTEGWLKDSTLDTRNQLYYDLLYSWLCLKQKGIKFCEFLRYKKIGIYGYGRIGQLLYKEIKDMDAKISFVQKQGAYITEEGIEVFDLNDLKEQKDMFDVIIITPIYEAEKIKIEITNYYQGNIMVVDELLEYINKNLLLEEN